MLHLLTVYFNHRVSLDPLGLFLKAHLQLDGCIHLLSAGSRQVRLTFAKMPTTETQCTLILMSPQCGRYPTIHTEPVLDGNACKLEEVYEMFNSA